MCLVYANSECETLSEQHEDRDLDALDTMMHKMGVDDQSNGVD